VAGQGVQLPIRMHSKRQGLIVSLFSSLVNEIPASRGHSPPRMSPARQPALAYPASLAAAVAFGRPRAGDLLSGSAAAVW
jgi:hypothetical protein